MSRTRSIDASLVILDDDEAEVDVDGGGESDRVDVVDVVVAVGPQNHDLGVQNDEDDFVVERGRHGHRKRGLQGATPTVTREPRKSLVGTSGKEDFLIRDVCELLLLLLLLLLFLLLKG